MSISDSRQMQTLISHLPSEGRPGPTLVGLVGLLCSETLIGDVQSEELIHKHSK